MRVLHWLLILLLTLIAATGGTLLIGRAQPDQNPLRAWGVDLCNNIPCFRDIVPGVTSWLTVTERFNADSQIASFQALIDEKNFIVFSATAKDADNGITPESTVSSFAIYCGVGLEHCPFIEVGEFISVLGMPCSFGISGLIPNPRIGYPSFSVGLDWEETRISGHILVAGILISESTEETKAHNCVENNDIFTTYKWKGFASFRVYSLLAQ